MRTDDPGPFFGDGLFPGGVDVFDYGINFMVALIFVGLFSIPLVLALGVYYLVLGVVPRRLSIYREYAADRGAALLTGNPAALASALRALAGASNRPRAALRQATDIQALCLVSDGITTDVEVGPARRAIAEELPMLDAVFGYLPTAIAAHLSIEDRITRLQELTATLEKQ